MLDDDFFTRSGLALEMDDEFGPGSMQDCLDQAAETDLEIYATPSSTRVRLEGFAAIRALYFDLEVRYDESGSELFNHLYEFLREDS